MEKKNIPKSFEKMNATLEITKENIIFSSQNKWRKRTSLHVTLAHLLVNLWFLLITLQVEGIGSWIKPDTE